MADHPETRQGSHKSKDAKISDCQKTYTRIRGIRESQRPVSRPAFMLSLYIFARHSHTHTHTGVGGDAPGAIFARHACARVIRSPMQPLPVNFKIREFEKMLARDSKMQ